MREIAPSAWLQPYVRLFWCLELDAPREFGPPERIAPDGIAELVFHYRQPMAVRFRDEGLGPQPRSSVVFQTRRFIEIEPRGSTGLISVRFQPWGVRHFLRLPLRELSDRVVAAEEVWGTAIGELEERLAVAAGSRSRVALVEQFLQRQFCPVCGPDIEVAVRTIWGSQGQMGVASLCRRLGASERTLQRVFDAALGMPPRSFIRLSRFLHACAALSRGGQGTLTEVAYDCGYYDQAHFISDFQAYAGMTPGEFVGAPFLSFLEPA